MKIVTETFTCKASVFLGYWKEHESKSPVSDQSMLISNT